MCDDVGIADILIQDKASQLLIRVKIHGRDVKHHAVSIIEYGEFRMGYRRRYGHKSVVLRFVD